MQDLLAAHEVRADEVVVGDVMDHRTVSLGGGLGQVVSAKVVGVETFEGDLEVELADHYAFSYSPDDTVVVYRPI